MPGRRYTVTVDRMANAKSFINFLTNNNSCSTVKVFTHWLNNNNWLNNCYYSVG